jgi:hypothetical protein
VGARPHLCVCVCVCTLRAQAVQALVQRIRQCETQQGLLVLQPPAGYNHQRTETASDTNKNNPISLDLNPSTINFSSATDTGAILNTYATVFSTVAFVSGCQQKVPRVLLRGWMLSEAFVAALSGTIPWWVVDVGLEACEWEDMEVVGGLLRALPESVTRVRVKCEVGTGPTRAQVRLR